MTMLAIPAWPDPSTKEGAAFFANATAYVTALKAHLDSNAFALGMLANAEAESSLDPAAEGDHVGSGAGRVATAFGLHQWHADRIAAIKAGSGIDIVTFPPVEIQAEAVWWELQ